MQLGHQVILVNGARRSALYDLYRRRLVRIPEVLASRIASDGGIDLSAAALQSAVVQDLLTRRFIGNFGALAHKGRLQFEMASQAPLLPILHTLTLESQGTWASQKEWVAAGVASGVRFVTVFAPSGEHASIHASLQEISASAGHIFCGFELSSETATTWTQTSIYDANGEAFATRHRLTGDRAFPTKFRVDEQHYSLLRQASELTGHLFVDASLEARPHPLETTISFGSILSHDPFTMVRSEGYKTVVDNRKDLREKCRVCELRLACVHPFADRINPDDIASAPAGCRYDPEALATQTHLFE